MGPFVNWTGNINIQICYDQRPKLLNFRAQSVLSPLGGLLKPFPFSESHFNCQSFLRVKRKSFPLKVFTVDIKWQKIILTKS